MYDALFSKTVGMADAAHPMFATAKIPPTLNPILLIKKSYRFLAKTDL